MAVFASRLVAFHDGLTRFGFALAQLCLLAIVFSYCYETVARYFFNAPTWWSNEIVAYALCIGTFLSLPEVTRRGGHISITFLTDLLPPGPRSWVTRALSILAGGVCLWVGWILLDMNLTQFVREEMLVRVKPIPKVWISVWITYGFLSAGLHFLRHAASARDTPGQVVL
ncbi:MAG: TRAP transporter small permease [Jannaschia sp.]